MKAARSATTLGAAVAALILAGVLGTFPHGHGTFLPAPSAPCPDTKSGDRCTGAHLAQATDDDDADSCTICFFNRCASHTTAAAAHDLVVALDETPLVCSSGALPDRFLASHNEARGPPAA